LSIPVSESFYESVIPNRFSGKEPAASGNDDLAKTDSHHEIIQHAPNDLFFIE
jgi:hypothetical protein